MFELFERQPNWVLKQLVRETDQPAVWFLFHCISMNILHTRHSLFQLTERFLSFYVAAHMEAVKDTKLSLFGLAAICERDTE